MSRYFPRQAMMTAVLVALAMPAAAQQAPDAGAKPVAEAGARVAVPQMLQDAGLTEVTSKRAMRDGSRFEGKLPDGGRLEAMVDAGGQLRALRVRDGVLPQALIAQMVPQPVRDSAMFGEIKTLEAIFSGPRNLMLAGRDAEGATLRAGFAGDGTLLRFSRGDEDGPRDKGFWNRARGDDQRRPGMRDHGPHGQDRQHFGRERPQGAKVEAALGQQVQKVLADAGYTDIGTISRHGPRIFVDAQNPEGEAVIVEITPDAKVTREISR